MLNLCTRRARLHRIAIWRFFGQDPRVVSPYTRFPLVLLVQLSEPVKGTGEPERALVGQQGGPKRGPARWAAEPPQSRPATRTPVVYGGHTWLADVLDWRTSTLKGRRETLQEPRFYQGRPP